MATQYTVYQPAIQPPFQQLTWGQRWGAALGSVKDQIIEQTIEGVMARMPGLAPLDAIGELGIERGIVQGPNETTQHYVARLLNAWGAWTIGGMYWGLLAQLNGAGYTTAYVIATNGYIYGPSSDVTAPDPINEIIGNPPSWVQVPPWYTNGSAPTGQEWAASTVYALGSIVIPESPNGNYFQCIVAGISGSSEPAIFATTPVTVGTQVTDGGVTWVFVANYTAAPHYPPWTFSSGDGQGDPGAPIGGDPSVTGSFWSRFAVMFSPLPSTSGGPDWTDVVNPPTPTTSPSQAEIANIRATIAKWKPGKSQCVGILAIASGSYCMGWPFVTTTNIPFDCWLARAIATGDAPSNTAFLKNYPQAVNSWSPNTTIQPPGGGSDIFMVPSEYYQSVNPTHRYLYYLSSGSPITTGLVEPTWPSSGTVGDNGNTWIYTASLNEWGTLGGSVCFQA